MIGDPYGVKPHQLDVLRELTEVVQFAAPAAGERGIKTPTFILRR